MLVGSAQGGHHGRLLRPAASRLGRRGLGVPDAVAAGLADACLVQQPVDGRRRAMSARGALLRMADDGLLALPSTRTGNGNRRWPLHLPAASTEPVPVHTSLTELPPLRIRLSSTATELSPRPKT